MTIRPGNRRAAMATSGMRYRLQSPDGRYAGYALRPYTVSLGDESTAYVFERWADAHAAAGAFGRELGIRLRIRPYPFTGGIRVGDTVRFRAPQTQDESSERFRVMEMRGTRVLVRSEDRSMRIVPIFVYSTDDLALDA